MRLAIQLVHSLRRFRPAWPNSPILGKEMRVTSRRGWLYGLRAAYVAVLGVFTAIVWGASTRGLTVGTAAASAADAGKDIIGSIIWFQFLVAQGITVILLSASVSGEIRRRTLPLLLTTPLGYFQIVWEKVVGGLSYVVVLLLCCLPLLSVVRIFGGVPWGFVLTSLGVTVTACFFAAAVATYFSTVTGNSFSAALLSLVSVAGYSFAGWMDVPVILIVLDIGLCAGLFRREEPNPPRGPSVPIFFLRVVGSVVGLLLLFVAWAVAVAGGMILALSPGYALARSTENMMLPGKQVAPELMLAIHCAATALVSLAVLRRCSFRLRQTARSRIWGLDPLVGQPLVDPAVAARALAEMDRPRIPPAAANVIDHLAGEAAAPASAWPARAPDARAAQEPAWTPPLLGERFGSALLWKDTRRMLFQNDALRFFGQLMPLSIIAIVYVFSLLTVAFRHVAWHSVMLSIYVMAGTVLTAVFSATALSTERQSRTWPILLTTGLSDWHILWAKSVGVFYRCLPAWGPLLIHAAVFTLCLQLHGLALVGMVLMVGWIHLFLCGSGFYFSMVLRGTSLPLIANLATAGFLWLIVPGLAPLAGDALGVRDASRDVLLRLEDLEAMTPLGQTINLIGASPGAWSLDEPKFGPWSRPYYRLDGTTPSPMREAAIRAGVSLAVYGSLGALLLGSACRRFRRNAFA